MIKDRYNLTDNELGIIWRLTIVILSPIPNNNNLKIRLMISITVVFLSNKLQIPFCDKVGLDLIFKRLIITITNIFNGSLSFSSNIPHYFPYITANKRLVSPLCLDFLGLRILINAQVCQSVPAEKHGYSEQHKMADKVNQQNKHPIILGQIGDGYHLRIVHPRCNYSGEIGLRSIGSPQQIRRSLFRCYWVLVRGSKLARPSFHQSPLDV